jgi:hypothetical protein
MSCSFIRGHRRIRGTHCTSEWNYPITNYFQATVYEAIPTVLLQLCTGCNVRVIYCECYYLMKQITGTVWAGSASRTSAWRPVDAPCPAPLICACAARHGESARDWTDRHRSERVICSAHCSVSGLWLSSLYCWSYTRHPVGSDTTRGLNPDHQLSL